MDGRTCPKGRKTRASAVWVLPCYQYCQCLFMFSVDGKVQNSDIRKSESENYKFPVPVCFSESCLRVTETQSTCLKVYFAMSCVIFGIQHLICSVFAYESSVWRLHELRNSVCPKTSRKKVKGLWLCWVRSFICPTRSKYSTRKLSLKLGGKSEDFRI